MTRSTKAPLSATAQGADPEPDEHGPPAIGAAPAPLVRSLSWLTIAWERLWPLLVPAFIALCLFLIVSWLGLWTQIPDWARYVGLGLFALAFLWTLMPLREWRMPDRQETIDRIERSSNLVHRPVTAQVDRQANEGDSFASILWEEHRRRMAEKVRDLSSGTPSPDGNRFDRFALRALVPVVAFAALGYSYSVHGGSVADAFGPRLDRAAILSRLDVWITPPAYTAKPPLYLEARTLSAEDNGNGEEVQQASASVTTLSGSALTIRHVDLDGIGQAISARLRSADKTEQLQREAGDATEAVSFSGVLEESAELEVLIGEEVLAAWAVTVEQDIVPIIRLDEMPGAARSGALELNYSVEDDYGVVSARALFSRVEQDNAPDARPLVEPPELQLPLPRARARNGATKVNRDLSAHPWAGSEVELVLEATDDPGQTGRSSPVRFTLPGRTFNDSLARALVEQRRILAMNANDAPLVANLLDAVTTHPEVFDMDMGAYLALRSTYRMVARARNDDKLREAMDVLWETALALELGDLSDVERRLREAQEKLSEALEQGASDEEIERLMEELRQAMNDFLEQMARQQAENPIENNPLRNFDNLEFLTQRDLERMMQRIEDLAKSGSKDAARELLSELQRMMDNLMAGQHQQQRQAEGNELNQALDKLSELMQRQQELMEETFSMQRRQPQQGQQQQGQNQQNQQQQGQNQQGENQQSGEGEMTPEEFAEALEQLRQQQEELRKQLGELGQQLEDLGLDPSEQFGEAGREMGEAGENLGQGDSGAAAGNQGQALEALRRGAQSMMQQMAGDRNQGGQQPNGEAGNPQQRQDGTDPLGRRNQARGRIDDGSTRIPGEVDAQRAREIMEAIRRRLSDPLRPLLERDYLERLLQSR